MRTAIKLTLTWLLAFAGAAQATTSYGNPMSSGYRIPSVTLTASSELTSTRDPTLLIDGISNAGVFYFVNGVDVTGKYVRLDFGAGNQRVIDEAKWYQDAANSHGSWKWQGSQDAASWSDIGSSFTLGGATTQTQTELNGNTTAYRYYQLLGVSGNSSSGPYLYEIEFKVDNATEIVPHDLTTPISHSPYSVSASSGYVIAGGSDSSGTYGGWRILDGGKDRWLGILSGVEWIQIGLAALTDFTPHDLTSNTSHSPIVLTASSEYSASYAAWKTLDGDDAGTTAWWIGTGNGVDWIKYDFGAGNEKILGSYTIRAAGQANGYQRQPKNWTVQGSNNDSDWSTISTVTNQTNWEGDGTYPPSVFPVRSFACSPTTTAYRYFKIDITANNGDANYTQIDQVYFYELGTATPAAKILGSYQIKASFETLNADRAPHDWTVKGSNDKGNWTTVDTVTGESSWYPGQTRLYTADTATTAYQFFKLDITANNGNATYTEIAEWYLYEGAPASQIKSVSTVPLAGIKKVAGVAIGDVKIVAGVANQ